MFQWNSMNHTSMFSLVRSDSCRRDRTQGWQGTPGSTRLRTQGRTLPKTWPSPSTRRWPEPRDEGSLRARLAAPDCPRQSQLSRPAHRVHNPGNGNCPCGLGARPRPLISWHSFRHTHATLLRDLGESLKTAQAQLGHASLSTTAEIYTDAVPASQRAAVEKVERSIWNAKSDPNPKCSRRSAVR
jgi:hypothetical protein